MNIERFLLSGGFFGAVALALAATALLVAGLGYRKMAVALSLVFVGAPAGSAVAAVVAAMLALRAAGRGEGAGVAAMLLTIGVAALTWAGLMLAGAAWVVLRRSRYGTRVGRNTGLLAGAAACGALSVLTITLQVVAATPSLQSDAALARDAGGISGPDRAEAKAQLLARGADAVPDVIAALRATPREPLYEFESGLNMPAIERLGVLGELGGTEAIGELRQWLNSGYAADVRAAAAAALGAAGDRESIGAIAALLENDTYDWKNQRSVLVHALGELDAEAEVGRIRAATRFTADERGSSYHIMLVGATVQAPAKIDTAESWELIEALGNSDDSGQNETVSRALK